MSSAVLSGLGTLAAEGVWDIFRGERVSTATDIRDLLLDTVPFMLDDALDMAGAVAYDIYDTNRVSAGVSGGYDFIIRDVPSRSAEALARWAVKPAFSAGEVAPTEVFDRVAAAVADEAVKAAREAQWLTGRRDRAVRGYARTATPDACDFCRMLATRGGVYHSRESAGAWTKFHTGCFCEVHPVYKR